MVQVTVDTGKKVLVAKAMGGGVIRIERNNRFVENAELKHDRLGAFLKTESGRLKEEDRVLLEEELQAWETRHHRRLN